MNNKDNSSDTQLNLFNIEPIKFLPKVNEKKVVDDYTFNLMDALQAPVITHSPMWADTIPERFLKKLPFARMIALWKGEQLATYLECSIYMYTASLDAPMTSDWTTIYCHFSCKVLEELFNEDHWQNLDATKVLDEYRSSKLDSLRRSIYTKRRELLKKRIKEQNKTEKDGLKTNNSSPCALQELLFSTTNTGTAAVEV